MEPSEIIRSVAELVEIGVIGRPSFVQVYAMFGGLPSACSDITNGSFSIPIVSSATRSNTGLSVTQSCYVVG